MSQPPTSPLSRIPRAIAASASLESAPFGVLWIDHDGGVGYANEQVESLLGWPVDELVGQKISQLATFWSDTEWQETVWKKAGEKQLTPIEGSWQCQDGNSCLLSAHLHRLQVAGQDMLAMYLHPTGKGAAASASSAGQSGYTEFLDHVPAGVCMADADLKILQINPKLCEIAGTDASSAISTLR